MADVVSDVAFPDDGRLGFNIQFDFGDAWYSKRPTDAIGPIQDAVAIRI